MPESESSAAPSDAHASTHHALSAALFGVVHRAHLAWRDAGTAFLVGDRSQSDAGLQQRASGADAAAATWHRQPGADHPRQATSNDAHVLQSE